MAHYSTERKEAVLKRMLPPENISIPKLSDETGINVTTLYKWRKDLRGSGKQPQVIKSCRISGAQETSSS